MHARSRYHQKSSPLHLVSADEEITELVQEVSMIRIFFVAAGMALVAGLVFSPVAIVPVFFVVFAMVSFLNLGKLKMSLL